MTDGPEPATIVVLNGAPRSGKSALARALQRTAAGTWMAFGVDAMMAATPPDLLPGIGLRPGGERPDLEPVVQQSYRALVDAVVAFSARGLNIVVDVGIHEGHSRPLGVLGEVAAGLADSRAYLIGVRCELEVILQRRAASSGYEVRTVDGSIPTPVLAWQRLVHDPGLYDLEVDTSATEAHDLAAEIERHVAVAPPTAFRRLVQG